MGTVHVSVTAVSSSAGFSSPFSGSLMEIGILSVVLTHGAMTRVR